MVLLWVVSTVLEYQLLISRLSACTDHHFLTSSLRTILPSVHSLVSWKFKLIGCLLKCRVRVLLARETETKETSPALTESDCIVGEVSSTRLRSKTVGLARNLYNIVGIVAGILNTYMMNPTAWNWKGYAGFFWVGPHLPSIQFYLDLEHCTLLSVK